MHAHTHAQPGLPRFVERPLEKGKFWAGLWIREGGEILKTGRQPIPHSWSNETEPNRSEIAFRDFQKFLAQKNLKQSWLPAFWKKIQNTQEIKRMLFIWTKQDKMPNFWESPLFQATYNIKTEKQLIQLILCHLDVGSWWREKGTKLKWTSPALFLPPATSTSWTVCFSVLSSLKQRTS